MATILFLLGFSALVAVARAVHVGSRRKTDERHWQSWTTMAQYGACPPEAGPALGKLIGIRQSARTGLKGWVQWTATGEVTPVWFAGRWPALGSYVVAYGRRGYGTHHDEHGVVYIAPHDLIWSVPASVRQAWERHERRRLALARQAPETAAPSRDHEFFAAPERPL